MPVEAPSRRRGTQPGPSHAGFYDYYVDGSETRGRSIGTGVNLLGLADEITAENLGAVLCAFHWARAFPGWQHVRTLNERSWWNPISPIVAGRSRSWQHK